MQNHTLALVASIIRTIVPVIVGAVTAQFVSWGLSPDPELATTLEAVLTAVFTGVYYVVVRLLETYVWPKLGWLLLFPQQPQQYTKDSPKHRA